MPTRIATLSTLIAAAAAAAPAAASAKAPAAKAHIGAQCANANLRVTSADRSHAEAAVVCLINQQRTAHRLPALKANAKLDRSAQVWTNTMVAHNTFGHGTDFAARIASAGFKWTAAGQNIASGYTTPFAVVRAWMGDAGHCQNILRPMFDYVGTGLSAGGNSHGAMGDTWTQDFGLLSGTRTDTSNMKPADGCPYKISERTAAPRPTLVKPQPGDRVSASASPTPAATDAGPTISW